MAAAMRGLGLRLNTQSAKAGLNPSTFARRQADLMTPQSLSNTQELPGVQVQETPNLQSIGASTYLLTSERRRNGD